MQSRPLSQHRSTPYLGQENKSLIIQHGKSFEREQQEGTRPWTAPNFSSSSAAVAFAETARRRATKDDFSEILDDAGVLMTCILERCLRDWP
jgi:hypothetical protein